MKNIIKLIAVTTALLPLGQLQAKTFGGFAPKKTFTLTVTDKFVVKRLNSSGSIITTDPVPKGIVKLLVDQRVKFTIGARGQLIAKGFEVPFKGGTSRSDLNVYSNLSNKNPIIPPGNSSQCIFFKDSRGEPVGGQLKFYQVNGKGLKETFTTVEYDLSKK